MNALMNLPSTFPAMAVALTPCSFRNVVRPRLAFVLLGQGQHLVGHVQPISLPRGAYSAGRQEHIDPAARSQVQHHFARNPLHGPSEASRCPVSPLQVLGYRAIGGAKNGFDNGGHFIRLTAKGVQVALLFLFFHKRLCGPLANSRFHHHPNPAHRPPSKLEAAYHKADQSIQEIVDLLAAA
jgi:hypothetical protein